MVNIRLSCRVLFITDFVDDYTQTTHVRLLGFFNKFLVAFRTLTIIIMTFPYSRFIFVQAVSCTAIFVHLS